MSLKRAKTKIAFFNLEVWEKDYFSRELKSKNFNFQLKFFDEPLSISNVDKIKDCQIIGVFIYSKIDEKILKKLPNLRLIATLSTGYDHIYLEECKKRKIAVCNVPNYGENTVAEHTFSLMLNLTRKIHKAYERTKQGDFTVDGLRGTDLKDKTIGVVGTGSIGRHVIRIAKGFEMNVVAYDKFKSRKLAKELGFRYVPFDKLLSSSDIITLHVPYFKETYHMINKKNLKKIKKGCYLINTARGEIVETEAIIKGLKEGIFAGAGLDVLEGECIIREEKQILSKEFAKECDLRVVLQDHILLKQDNVIITPHNAFNSWEALKRILDTTIVNIKSFIDGKPINRVN